MESLMGTMTYALKRWEDALDRANAMFFARDPHHPLYQVAINGGIKNIHNKCPFYLWARKRTHRYMERLVDEWLSEIETRKDTAMAIARLIRRCLHEERIEISRIDLWYKIYTKLDPSSIETATWTSRGDVVLSVKKRGVVLQDQRGEEEKQAEMEARRKMFHTIFGDEELVEKVMEQSLYSSPLPFAFLRKNSTLKHVNEALRIWHLTRHPLFTTPSRRSPGALRQQKRRKLKMDATQVLPDLNTDEKA